jgi:hypothetical protein
MCIPCLSLPHPSSGVDILLARHLAHLFIRDPLVIYDGKLELDDTQTSDHFEARAVMLRRAC